MLPGVSQENREKMSRVVLDFLDHLDRLDDEQRPCCDFFNVDNIIYKGHYLPGVEEFVAHGYKRELYDSFLKGWKESIDEHGHL